MNVVDVWHGGDGIDPYNMNIIHNTYKLFFISFNLTVAVCWYFIADFHQVSDYGFFAQQ